jgi:restriction system protein
VIERIRGFEGEALSARCIGYLRAVDPWVFEEVVLTCLEEGGAAILRNTAYTNDGGIDGRVHSVEAAQWIPVQCKRFERHVCRSDIFDFQKLLQERGYKRGLFVHTGRTGVAIRGSLRESEVELVSGEKLALLVRSATLPRL